MKYYIISDSINLKEVGKYSQCRLMGEGYNYNADYSIRKLPVEGPPRYELNVDCFQLEHHAKVTDFISAVPANTPTNLLISTRMYQLLSDFKIGDVLVWESRVQHQKKSHPYKFVYFPTPSNHFIDFPNSRFYLTNMFNWLEDISFKDFDDYMVQRKILDEANPVLWAAGQRAKFIRYIEVRMDETKIDLDLFKLNVNRPLTIISERLLEAMQKEKITGYQVEPFEHVTFPFTEYEFDPPRHHA